MGDWDIKGTHPDGQRLVYENGAVETIADFQERTGRFYLDEAERRTAAFVRIGESLSRLADVTEKLFNKRYPERGAPQDAKVTKVPSEEDIMREEQRGDETQPIEEWIGPRELEFERRQGAQVAPAGKSSSPPKTRHRSQRARKGS